MANAALQDHTPLSVGGPNLIKNGVSVATVSQASPWVGMLAHSPKLTTLLLYRTFLSMTKVMMKMDQTVFGPCLWMEVATPREA